VELYEYIKGAAVHGELMRRNVLQFHSSAKGACGLCKRLLVSDGIPPFSQRTREQRGAEH